MPPACPVDIYVRRYTQTPAQKPFFSPFRSDGNAVAAERGKESRQRAGQM
jgi:hypothetical protein